MHEVAKSRLRDESLGSPRPEIATLLTLLQYIFRTEYTDPQLCVSRVRRVYTRVKSCMFRGHHDTVSFPASPREFPAEELRPRSSNLAAFWAIGEGSP